MIRRLLFLIIVPTLLIGYKITPVLAQDKKESLEIQKVVDNFYKSLALGDVESMMKHISANYYDEVNGEIVDYAQFKSTIENMLDTWFKQYTNFSINYLKITKLDIQGDKATLEVKSRWNGFNVDAARKESGSRKRFFALEKEDGLWKIARIKRLGSI
ncbi:MAG: hypothetical protein V1828_00250 [Candidatus Omnitrophota bacterium]